ncbi:YhbY-like protein [Dioscorea alata]|uniref:YhbY-like protein n=2 Tax=Dioscorea alata TaxID=55571 RepID=A0ACB7UKL9_DIOAL|nr:YhbY-like protein [Dioscorea alata]KAH7660989.1 YhbY-like protein [Dioscorea alata]
MLGLRHLNRHCLRALSVLQNRGSLHRDASWQIKANCEIRSQTYEMNLTSASSFGLPNICRMMSTTKGRSMRSKVEKRMRRETGKTLREIRRAKKLRKKLMTDEERLIYNLRRAKKKVALLLQKLKKYELPELPAPRHDPELLTPEQLQAYKKIGFRNRNYVPVGVRGVFGGVVQNMHLHWKFHETVQVCCDNFPKERIKEMATMIARLSGGIVVNIHNVKTIIMFRGRNYRQPKNLIPINTLTKRKALFKARFEQALESQKLNIKKLEQQLRRMGVNPEDPVAMASIQRVASTFFRAIDEQQGTPYVFREDRQPVSGIDDAGEESPAVQSEDSDQEELDRFIAEIEEAADQEWAAEEAAEREEASRIRYWGKEEMGMRGRSSQWRDYNDFEEDAGGRGRGQDSRSGNKPRTMNIRKWDSDDEVSEASEGMESDLNNDVDDQDSEDDDSPVLRTRNKDLGGGRGKIRRQLHSSDTKLNAQSEFDEFDNSEDELWGSEYGPKASKDNVNNYISSGEESDTLARPSAVLSKKNMDESWDSD